MCRPLLRRGRCDPAYLVAALPATREAHVRQAREATRRDLEDALEPRGIGRSVCAGRLLAVGHAEEKPWPFAMEVEAGREVDGERDPRRKIVGRPGESDLAQVRLDRELDSGVAADLGRPNARRADDGPRLDPAEARVDGTNLSVGGRDCGDLAAREHPCAVLPGAGRVTLRDRVGARVAGERAERRGEDAVEPRERAQLAHLVEVEKPAWHPELVLRLNARLERRDVLLAVEQEEVADLLEVDLGARPVAEARERLDAAKPDRDVQRIRELRAEASRGTARGAARELVALEQAHLCPGLGEVEGDARPDDAAADHDDIRTSREPAHLRTRLRRKNPRFAGRSASLRMRYGNQSGPNGAATSTL